MFFNNLFAQSVKEPSPAEKKLLHKSIVIIQSVLDQFGNNDWSLDQDWYNNDPLVPVDDDGTGAIGIDQNFERDYKVNENSKRFNEIIKPLYDKSQVLMNKVVAKMKEYEKNPPKNNEMENDPDSDSLNALDHRLQELSELHVYAYINYAAIEGKQVKEINIPGASMITKLNSGHFAQDYFKSYYIAFGNWKNAKWNSDDNAFFFKFKNTKSSSIQNIVIVMTGAQDRMKDLMHKINWSVLNKALTN